MKTKIKFNRFYFHKLLHLPVYLSNLPNFFIWYTWEETDLPMKKQIHLKVHTPDINISFVWMREDIDKITWVECKREAMLMKKGNDGGRKSMMIMMIQDTCGVSGRDKDMNVLV